MNGSSVIFLIIIVLTAIAAGAWWQSGIPTICFISEKWCERILKYGFTFGIGGALGSLMWTSFAESAGIAVLVVVSLLFVERFLIGRSI